MIIENNVSCDTSEESFRAVVYVEVLVETRYVFSQFPGFIAGLQKVSMNVFEHDQDLN